MFSHTDDFNSLSDVAKKYPSIQEIAINNKEHFQTLIETTNNDKDIIPLFIKNSDSELQIITSHNTEIEDLKEGSSLVYLGKPFDNPNFYIIKICLQALCRFVVELF